MTLVSDHAGLGPHNTGLCHAWAGPKSHTSGRAIGLRAAWSSIGSLHNFCTLFFPKKEKKKGTRKFVPVLFLDTSLYMQEL
jgi:hypothetical protein